MRKRIYFGAVALISMALFSACKKGDTGPAGAAGAPGANPTNTVSTHTFSVSSWSSDVATWFVQFHDSALTQTANKSAAIEVFFSRDSMVTWYALPFTQVYTPANYNMSFLTQDTLVEVDWNYDGGTPGTNPNSFYGVNTIYFKVVIIPPSMRKGEVDLKNYMALKKEYGLKD